jgi:hypothetical protein
VKSDMSQRQNPARAVGVEWQVSHKRDPERQLKIRKKQTIHNQGVINGVFETCGSNLVEE